MTDVYLTRACSLTGELGRQLSLVLSGIAKAGTPVSSSVMPQSPRKRDKKSPEGECWQLPAQEHRLYANPQPAVRAPACCARAASPARCVRPRRTSIQPVFEFRVEKELGYDLDAAGASV